MEQIAAAFVRRRRDLAHRGQVGRGRRYPQAMIGMAVRFAETAAAVGWSERQMAQRLGIPVATLARWRQREEDSSESLLHEVVVAEEAALGGDERRVTVVTPQGYRVEGLELAEVAALLAALAR